MQRGFWDQLEKPIIGLSPMDGVSDAPFRFITAKYGKPSLLITEFTNVEAINHAGIKALSAFIYNEIERPIVAQIYGINPKAFYKTAIIVCELGFDGIDINMGCPSKAVSGNGAGAGLIKTPDLAREIIKTCKQAVEDWSNGKTLEELDLDPLIFQYIQELKKEKNIITERKILPISVKTRIGYDQIVTLDWIKNLLEEEPANITLHGRTLKQMYTGLANWNEIAKAAELIHQSGLKTTILGNGDVKSLEIAYENIKNYGVDGVLIGRGSYGEPWIFRGEHKSLKQKLEVALEHAKAYEKIFGIGEKSFAPMKKHLGWYCTDFPNAKELRMQLIRCNSADEVENIIKNINLE